MIHVSSQLKFIARHRIISLLAIANFITGCAATFSENEVAVLNGVIVESHHVTAAPALAAYHPMPPTPDNIARVRRSLIASGNRSYTDQEIKQLIESLFASNTGLPAEPDHKLYVIDNMQGKKYYFRSTDEYAVGICVEVRIKPAHRAKNSWMLGETTIRTMPSC